MESSPRTGQDVPLSPTPDPELLPANDVVVLDFETTGLSPARGDRAIEIGAVRIVGGRITDHFAELMNPGMPVSSFITGLTGITNAMLFRAPPCAEVMARFADYLGDSPVVAHNIRFDELFLEAELRRIHRWHDPPRACTMECARRVITDAHNHRLGTLVAHCCIPNEGTFHRALADADMTARLWILLLENLKRQYDLDPVSFAFMQRLMKANRKKPELFLESERAARFGRDAAPGGQELAIRREGPSGAAGPPPAG
ncbi:MAG: DNA polymerase III subunit epsilon [Deltaproteobacteria bacterium HGW-Deltaproteobacteria-17]|nr:MAG: DNA polymerase III subunit epsilon [Deltaproteobacteria bacterium HGW-Deltaproteobacteria-17]